MKLSDRERRSTIAKILDYLERDYGYKMAEIARKLGTGEGTVWRWRHGKAHISSMSWERLLSVFGKEIARMEEMK